MATGLNRWRFARGNVVALVAICMFLFWLLNGQSSQRVRVDSAKLDRMIDALANRNEQPQFVRVSTSFDPVENPLFPEDYDWNEDRRVLDAAYKLRAVDGEELWWCLCEHLDDERYAISFAFNDLSRIASIGALAYFKTAAELEYAYTQHFPRVVAILSFRHMHVRRTKKEAIAWYREHRKIPLYQQQIEACQIALEKIRHLKIHPPSPADLAAFEADVTKQIEVLRRTKQPTLSGRRLLTPDTDYYSPELAAQIRKKHQLQSARKE